MPKQEYKGYELTKHKDGSYSIGWRDLQYTLASGHVVQKDLSGKNLEEMQQRIDAFLAEHEAKDKTFHETMATLSKQIVETHNSILLGIKTVQEKTLETLSNAIKCGELLTKAKEMMANSGKWQSWITTSCPGLSITTEKRYRQLYKKVQADGSYVSQAESLRQAYLLYGMIAETPPKKEPDTTSNDGDEKKNDTDTEADNDAPSGGGSGNGFVEAADKANAADAMTIEALVATLIDKVMNLEMGNERESHNDKLYLLFGLFTPDEIAEALLGQILQGDEAAGCEVMEPLVNWYDAHSPTKRNGKPKKTKKDKEAEKRYEEFKSILAAPAPVPTDNNQTSLTE